MSNGGGAYDVGDKVTLRGKFGTNPTHILAEAAASATAVTVANATGYASGDVLLLNPGGDTEELNTISTNGVTNGRTLNLSSALVHPHHVRESVWERTDPTVTVLKVKGPSGTTSQYTTSETTRESPGMFTYDLTLSSAGLYFYQWRGTGTAQAAGEGQFRVRPSQFATST